MDPLKPGDPGVVGRYRLSARLGQAGLGTVFLGRAPGGDHVTVKLVRPDLASDTTFMERFRQDATTAREVGGTHVAHVLDADADGTPPWLVTEHVAGPSLEEAVEAHGAFPEATLRALGAGLAEGLAAVHEAGLTHRDLKPANVLLGADGPRIADYSLARALGSAGMTRTGVADVPGLPAPEQVTGGSIGPATDVFALGGVLCHAAGVAPFGAGSVAEIAQSVVRQAPKLAELPDWLREIVVDCLKKRPTARPSAAELVERFAAKGEDAEAEAAANWLPAEVSALVTARTAEVRAGVLGQSGPDVAGVPKAERDKSAADGGGSDVGAGTADDAGGDGGGDAEEVAPAKVEANGSRAAQAAPAAGGAAGRPADRPRAGVAEAGDPAEDENENENDAADAAEPETAEVPALAAIVAAEAAEVASANDETPVATPAVRVAKGDDATP
ncbi:serine/threonine-protein kinase, partial [Streptomyces sp. SID3343]|uniref:serine/threonine-protein kinase n=1 Tax=Streptomyces sp. SID3343 TaxID=2690260 RepID=UPI00136C2618